MAIRRKTQKAQVIAQLQQVAPPGEQFLACVHCETRPEPVARHPVRRDPVRRPHRAADAAVLLHHRDQFARRDEQRQPLHQPPRPGHLLVPARPVPPGEREAGGPVELALRATAQQGEADPAQRRPLLARRARPADGQPAGPPADPGPARRPDARRPDAGCPDAGRAHAGRSGTAPGAPGLSSPPARGPSSTNAAGRCVRCAP